MQQLDQIIFGDNQFFGINHMSQEKSQQLAENFFDIREIFRIYDIAIENSIQGIMLNSNDRAKEICDHFRSNKKKYSQLSWYPSIPYPYKYANLVSEKGILPAINEILFKENRTTSVTEILIKGGNAVITRDVIKMMQMLIDAEMNIFSGLNVKVIFLQNIITDLFIGFDIPLVFKEYCDYITKKYNVLPGLITQNLPRTLQKLNEWRIKNVVICTSINKIGYLMSPDIKSYIESIKNNNPDKYQIIAMSTLASGAIPAPEAFDFINKQNIQSVVFGASTPEHIKETIKLINLDQDMPNKENK